MAMCKLSAARCMSRTEAGSLSVWNSALSVPFQKNRLPPPPPPLAPTTKPAGAADVGHKGRVVLAERGKIQAADFLAGLHFPFDDIGHQVAAGQAFSFGMEDHVVNMPRMTRHFTHE